MDNDTHGSCPHHLTHGPVPPRMGTGWTEGTRSRGLGQAVTPLRRGCSTDQDRALLVVFTGYKEGEDTAKPQAEAHLVLPEWEKRGWGSQGIVGGCGRSRSRLSLGRQMTETHICGNVHGLWDQDRCSQGSGQLPGGSWWFWGSQEGPGGGARRGSEQ